jgi:hypothetical protein
MGIENTVGDASLYNPDQQGRPKIILMNYFSKLRKDLLNGVSQKFRSSFVF